MMPRWTRMFLLPLLGAISAEPRSSVVVADAAGASLSFLDPITLTKVGQVQVGEGPHRVATSPDGRTAYVPLYGPGPENRDAPPGHQVAAIDLASRKVTRMIDVKPHSGPLGIAVDPGGLLWVTCEAEGSLLVIDPRRADALIAVVRLGVKGTYRVAASPDGARVYATSRDVPVISVVDARSRRLVKEIRLSHAVDGIALSPDGKTLYACPPGRRSLFVVDAENGRVSREFPLDEPAGSPTLSPDGRTLLLSHPESGTVGVLDAETLRQRGTVRVGRTPAAIAFATGGKTAYVTNSGGGSVTLFEVESLRVLRTGTAGKRPAGLTVIGR